MKQYFTQVKQPKLLSLSSTLVGALAFFYGFLGTIDITIAQEKSDWVDYSFPSFFANPDAGLRAVGIARKGIFNDSLTYKQAYDRAIESLNANLGTWYYAEHFDNSLGSNYHSFYEFSIEQNIDSSLVEVAGTKEINKWLFLEIVLKNVNDLGKDTTALNWVESVGSSQMLWTNPYAAFEKAKQNAIKEIAYTTNLKVMGKQWASGSFSGDLFFIKSKVLLNNVEVVSRRLKSGKCFVHIRVPKSGITTY